MFRLARYLPSLLGLLAAGLWVAWPALGPWPLILVALAFFARRLTAPARPLGTPFDGPLLIFLLAAAFGAWSAYSQPAGWHKFWLIAAGAAVYVSFVYLPDPEGPLSTSPLRALLLGAPAAISLYFLLSTDWMRWMDKLPWLNPLRSWMVTLGPAAPGYRLHPNAAGGILAALIPLQLAALSAGRRSGIRTGLGALCLAVSALGLFLSATRGAWLSLAIVLAAWGLWRLSGRAADRWRSLSDPRLRRVLWIAALAVVVVMLLVAAFATPLRGQMSELSGRWVLWRNSLDLALDYPLSGLGLASFEMPYSSYVLLVHVGYLTHAHNLLLDVWLGQGLLGLLSFGWLVAVAVRTRRPSSLWRHAALAALAVILLHGLMDDAFYGYDGLGVVLLFVPFALLVRSAEVPGGPQRPLAAAGRRAVSGVTIVCGLVGVLAVAALLFRDSRSVIQANLGALAQTRAELSAYQWPVWPIQDALRRSPEIDLAPAIAHYQAALTLNPRNVAANRRLGQIELSRGQYDAAQQHLSMAFAVAPGQRATRQMLGESYAIAGDVTRAAALWQTVDLDQQQLTLRQWWYEYIGETARAQWIAEAARPARRQG